MTKQFLDILQSAQEAPLPRHYTMEASSRTVSWTQRLTQLLPSHRWVRLAVLTFSALLFGLWLGQLSSGFRTAADPPLTSDDWQKMRQEVLQLVTEQNRQERLAWQTTWRQEMQDLAAGLSARQQQVTAAAISQLEDRMDRRLLAAAYTQQQRSSEQANQIVDALQAERQDMLPLNQRFNRLAVRGDARSLQTDALLTHILEISDQRLPSVP